MYSFLVLSNICRWRKDYEIYCEQTYPQIDTRASSGETLSGEIFVRLNYLSYEIFVSEQKIRHPRPTKDFAQ